MLVDEERLRHDYDEQVRLFGEPILRPGIYDRRVLVPRSAVPHVAERDAGMPLKLEHIDAMASDGLFTWLGGGRRRYRARCADVRRGPDRPVQQAPGEWMGPRGAT